MNTFEKLVLIGMSAIMRLMQGLLLKDEQAYDKAGLVIDAFEKQTSAYMKGELYIHNP